MIANSHENEALFRTSLKSDEMRIAFNEAAATYSPSFDAVMTVFRDRVSYVLVVRLASSPRGPRERAMTAFHFFETQRSSLRQAIATWHSVICRFTQFATKGAGLAHVYSVRIRPGGSDSSYRLARSDRPIGTNPLIFAVCTAGTPDFSSLPAIRPRKGMGRSRLRSSTTRAARRKRICRSSNSGAVQSTRSKA